MIDTTAPLPDEIEAAIVSAFDAVDCISRRQYGNDRRRAKIVANERMDALRHAIHTALAQAREDSALRERAERLRQAASRHWLDDQDYPDSPLRKGDLADNLQPAPDTAP